MQFELDDRQKNRQTFVRILRKYFCPLLPVKWVYVLLLTVVSLFLLLLDVHGKILRWKFGIAVFRKYVGIRKTCWRKKIMTSLFTLSHCTLNC
jgi:hypothetical protein